MVFQAFITNLFVVTAVFNPGNSQSRLDNYYRFEQHMKDSGINLFVIECIYGENQNYQVTQKGNPYHF